VKVIEYKAGDFEFEFAPSKGAPTKGELTTFVGEARVDSEIDLKKPDKQASYIAYARDVYPEVFQDELGLKRALNELCGHVKDEVRIAEAKRDEEGEDDEDSPEEHGVPAAGTPAHARAIALLTAHDVLDEVAQAMERLGHIGEESNKKLAFACAVSAKAQLPVQPSTHAQSSAGKNYLWDTALALIPPELVYKRTGFSAKALFRTSMSLKHSVLYIQELAGSEGADFSIRTLQSDNVLKWEASEKQPDGSIANVEYEVEGPTVIVQTTTKNHLHPENETRVVPLYLDETAEQTAKITKAALRRAAGFETLSKEERDELCATWHDAVRLLEPVEVLIPFAERVEVPSAPLRLRRDVPRLMNIIKLVAWVHQHTRKRDDAGRVLATEEDFHMAIRMVGTSFARAWKSLTPSEEKVYEACKELSEHLRKHGFRRVDVEKALEKNGEAISYTTLKNCLLTLASSGYLESDGKKGATGATYTLARGSGIEGTITLSGLPAINEKQSESRIGKPNPMADSQSGHSGPLANGEDERPIAENGPNGIGPLKRHDLQVKFENGRMAGKDTEKEGETSLGHYKFLD
jgi:hypothetical protein